jgi:preprotein translocase subunit SecY
LVSALLANIQLGARLLQNWLGRPTFLGGFSGNSAISGLAAWIQSPDILGSIIRGSVTPAAFGQAFIYLLLMISGCVIFSVFWVQTSGMDAKSQAKQIISSGLQIPGFRKDQRILETVLNRYIGPLTVMGGATIGLLAGLADLTGAIGSGTGILLTVMIIYKLYEEISKQHMMDMNPMMRKFIE